MARLITKGLIAVEDMSIGTSTFTRATSTGGTQVLHSIAGLPTGNLFFVDGVTYTTVAGALAAAVTAGGGTVDARGNNSAAALSLGTLDVGNAGPGVTIMLGPFHYTATKIIMRSGTRIYGTGRGNTSSGTKITMVPTSGSLIQFNTAPATDQPSQGVLLEGVDLDGPAGANTCNAILCDASTSTTSLGGAWLSRFSDVYIESTFGGHGIYLKGPAQVGNNGINQWLSFFNVGVARATGSAGNCLRIEGSNSFIAFFNCVFDSPTGLIDLTGSATNIFIGGPAAGTTFSYPNVVKFYDCASEGAATLVQIDGGTHLTFDHCHHENGNIGYLITYNVNGTAIYTHGVDILNCSFNSNVGVNGGNGALVKIDSSAANKVSNVQLYHSIYLSSSAQPDNWILNPTNGVGVNDYNNTYKGLGVQGVVRNPVATPTTTVKSGTASGVNYTNATTAFTAVDNTNLTYTAVVPIGWKLICMASFQQQVDTASVQVLARLQDTTAVVTLATSDIIPGINQLVGVSLVGVITGDAASHTVRLEFKTSNAADTTEIVNSTSGTPQMVFILAPSN